MVNGIHISIINIAGELASRTFSSFRAGFEPVITYTLIIVYFNERGKLPSVSLPHLKARIYFEFFACMDGKSGVLFALSVYEHANTL
jgi:hypothetical protein